VPVSRSDSIPTYQFRGTWVPVAIHKLLRDGAISSVEFVLLSTIDSLTDEDNGRGCWASNKFLGMAIHTSPVQIQAILTRLERKGLIRREYNPHRTIWPTYCTSVPTWKTRPPHLENQVGIEIEVLEKKKTVEANASTAPSEDGDMPFFQIKQPPTKTTPTEGDSRCAEKLRRDVQRRKFVHQWNKAKWAHDFRILRQKLEKIGRDSELEPTLDWYVAHVSDPGSKLPTKIVNASGFARNYEWIRETMTKNSSATVAPSEEALDIVKDLKQYRWPKGSDQELPEYVERTIQTHRKLIGGLRRELAAHEAREAKSKVHKTSHLHIAMKSVVTQLGMRDYFVSKWWEDVFKDIHGWDQWSGNLKSFAFDLKTKRSLKWAAGVMKEAGYGMDMWEKVMEAAK
jgi:hypothetical protein